MEQDCILSGWRKAEGAHTLLADDVWKGKGRHQPIGSLAPGAGTRDRVVALSLQGETKWRGMRLFAKTR
ncbi:hypothetical protein NJLHNGOC_12140 [Novacetimonas cocois]|uniref:Uncharacterized protein n=1 Tax=Novacetimonas cocois TaxID=1747507 RepID=A0A365YUR3_9PROT|nr:hypothetical protein NJLHNGOC_12140 [Novacetimonas cocois]